jgi:hypothetical protein
MYDMSKKCGNCKHYRPNSVWLAGWCLHPRLGGHPAVRGGLAVSANELMCVKAGPCFHERRLR